MPRPLPLLFLVLACLPWPWRALQAGPAEVVSALQAVGRTPAKVLEVTDGRRAWMEVDGKRERVVLIGLEVPPLVTDEIQDRAARRAGRSDKRTALEGELARRNLAALMPPGSTVLLELDAGPRDRWGRIQAYVHAGEVFVNGRMVRDGFARPRAEPPNLRRQEELDQARRDLEAARGPAAP